MNSDGAVICVIQRLEEEKKDSRYTFYHDTLQTNTANRRTEANSTYDDRTMD